MAVCPYYRQQFIEEVKKGKLFIDDRDRRKWSRIIFARDLPFWSYPPYCRYGYYCKKCPEISMLWKYGKIMEVQQLTLF